MLKYDVYRDLYYFPSKGTIVNVVLRDLDLNFQGHQFEMLVSWKW